MSSVSNPAVGVDTSIWIHYFRNMHEPIARHLDELLEEDRIVLLAPVEVELLLGVAKKEKPRLKRLLGALMTRRPNDDTWDWCRDVAVASREKGATLGATDLLIAGLCVAGPGEAIPLWTLDKDFDSVHVDLHTYRIC